MARFGLVCACATRLAHDVCCFVGGQYGFRVLRAAAQGVHVVSEVPEHAPLVYFPDPHAEQVLQVKPLLAPLQEPVRYFALAQFWLIHAEQAVLEAPAQPPLLYWPAVQLAQAEHAVSEVPEQPPVLYWVSGQTFSPCT